MPANENSKAPSLREAANMAQSFIRWTQFGECRTAGWDCAPPTASETDAALTAALALPEVELVKGVE